MIKTDVLKGKFLFCDVARGEIGKPLSFMQGNPLLHKPAHRINMPKCITNALILDHSIFRLILKSHNLKYQYRNSIFFSKGIPNLMTSQGDSYGNPN